MDTELINIESFFRDMTPKQRQQWKKRYEQLIAIERDELPATKNIRTGKMFKHTKMPWMLPHWQNGLKILNKVINEIDS